MDKASLISATTLLDAVLGPCAQVDERTWPERARACQQARSKSEP